MYKTFELFKKSIYIIVFWSIIFYVLEIRQHSSGFLSIATETAIGWVVFLTIIFLFATFVASSHRQTKNQTKDKITKNVIEDGMMFTVGGHTQIIPVIPEAFFVESEILNKYEEDNPNIENTKREFIQSTGRKIKDILEMPDTTTIHLSEEKLFKANEGGSEIYGDEEQRSTSNITTNQSSEEINKEANSNFQAISGQYTDDHESRRIDKGILAYKYQFNLMFSHILNYELFDLQDKIRKGSEKYSKKELIEKKLKLKQKSDLIQAEIEQSLIKVLETLPKFEYKGIVTTTPEIKNRRDLNLQDYQLIIFTTLFPHIDWITLRSCAALNALDPEVKKNLTSAELMKLDQSELGLSLRDKRILWNARRMYEIYVNRDRDVIAHGKSVFNMPVSFDSNGAMFNPLEETVALCEVLRASQTIRQIKTRKPKQTPKAPIYTDNDIIRLVYTIFSENNRFNTSNAFDRIGVIKSEMIYVDFDAFYPKFNGRFKEKYPHLANHLEYQKAFKVFYDKAKSMGLLAMRIRDENSDNVVETFSHKTDGELLNVFWEFKEKTNTLTIPNTLILHASQMFKDLLSGHQDYNANAKILGVSTTKAIPLSDYAEKIKPLIEAAEREKRRVKDIMESAKNITHAPASKTHSNIVDGMNQALAEQQSSTETSIDFEEQNNDLPATPKVEEFIEPSPTPKPVTATNQAKTEPDPLDGLSDMDSELLNNILAFSLSATTKDLGVSNNQLEGKTDEDAEDAFKYINREVQVVSLRLADTKQRASNGGHRYAINEFHKKHLQLIQCSRDAINDAALNLDFTILKVLDAAKANNYNEKNISHTTASRNILIKKTKIFALFNVIEQMALYQKKGNGSFWSIRQENCKASKSDEQFNQISVIECLTIDQSKEEAIYQSLRETMWNKEKAQVLFDEITVRLNDLDINTKKKHQILKDPASELYLIPKQHLGLLKRTSVNVNSFLAYCEQFKDELPPELEPYAKNLSAIICEGKPTIKFEKV